MIVLDTHALLWMDRNDAALGPSTRTLIEQSWRKEGVAVCALSFWEVAMLEARGRISLPVAAQLWRTDLLQAGVREIPLDGQLALIAASLDNFHKDPADRFIVATVVHHRALLVTADSQILAWGGVLKRQNARL